MTPSSACRLALSAAVALVAQPCSHAVPLAALVQERELMRGGKVGVIRCGGTIDIDRLFTVLRGGVPKV
jgi:threonine dehydratase